MTRIRDSKPTVDTSHDEEDTDSDGHSVASSSSSHCTLKACSASMNLHSSSSTRLSPSASLSSIHASVSKTSLTRALSNTCIQAVTSGTDIGSSLVPDLDSKTLDGQTKSWINYGLLGTRSSSSSSSLIFPKAPDPLFKQNFVANWITKASNSQPEGPNIVPLHGAAKYDKSDNQQHGGGDVRWLDNLGRGYYDDRQNTDDVSMDTQDDKHTVIGRTPFGFGGHSNDWFKNHRGHEAMDTDACMPSATCYIRPASSMYDNDVVMTSPKEKIKQPVLDIGEPMDLDDQVRNISSWTQNASSFFTTHTSTAVASTDISMVIDDDEDIQGANCPQPMIVDMLPQTNMGHRLSVSQSKTDIEMLSPTPSIEMLSPTPSIEMLSPTPSIEMLSPTSCVEMLSPTHSVEMLSPTPSIEMLSPTPSVSLNYIPKVFYSQGKLVIHTDTLKLELKSWLTTPSMNIQGATTTPIATSFTDTKRKPANKRKHEYEDDDKASPAKRRVTNSCDNITKYLKPAKRHSFIRSRNK